MVRTDSLTDTIETNNRFDVHRQLWTSTALPSVVCQMPMFNYSFWLTRQQQQSNNSIRYFHWECYYDYGILPFNWPKLLGPFQSSFTTFLNISMNRYESLFSTLYSELRTLLTTINTIQRGKCSYNTTIYNVWKG